ncbi:hypothetical protein NP493_528g00030 [Ridgeia piscesae]|uniref:G-protein coupled receptors family 1 profile domain-containing protein n=1 Tax=Ridgeia piscesae TaxID=27915 RepID=A0AAD9KWK5_RIDPI|nr:hypothetical protein NP493_3164g00008 [Ridgeia piscesae]KAK2178746.1 hypothetical protein NP493_528g00030 [Ridgeia piscesae]
MKYNDDYAMNISVEELNFKNVEHYCEAIIHPVIFTIGVTGNVVNLVVFTRQRMRHGKSDIEKAATMGLMFLAVSDMMYCVIGLMTHGPMALDATAKHAYTIIWSIFGNVVPLLTLAFCNVRFLVVIYHSQDRFTPRSSGDTARRNPLLNSTTVTFALIICFFFLLVCPAIVVKFIGNFVAEFSHKAYYRFQLTLVITNTMLAFNFAVNFLLYCYALRDFRKTLMNMVNWSVLAFGHVH